MNLETLIIAIVVTAAAIYAGRVLFRKARGKTDCCDSTPGHGCDGCGMADSCTTIHELCVTNEHSLSPAKETLQRQIAATDIQIDRLVYELYDLTEDEIKIVEEA